MPVLQYFAGFGIQSLEVNVRAIAGTVTGQILRLATVLPPPILAAQLARFHLHRVASQLGSRKVTRVPL